MPPEAPTAAAVPAAPPQRLRRLAGRSSSVRMSRAQATSRLWIGDAELVQETVRSYTQEIQRFALADIQAVQIRRTARGLVYNVVLAALLALALFIVGSIWATDARTVRWDGGHYAALGGVAAPFLLLLLVNTLRGPTCRTVLTTALGPQPLASLGRLRHARRALDAIIAGADAVQGALQPDEAARQIDRAQAQSTSPPASPPVAPRPDYHY